MSLANLNRKAILLVLAAVLLIAVLAKYGVFGGGQDSVVAAVDSVPVAIKRLEALRRKAALVPGREEVLHTLQAQLLLREKGIVDAPTAEQARAHLLETLHTLEAANGFNAGGNDTLPQPRALGKDYGQVSVGQTFNCGIDQLVNFLAAISNQPETLATESINIVSRNVKEKTIAVRLTLSGVVPKKLVPEKKGLGSF